MLRYATLCCAMPCHAMLCYAVLCYAMPCHAMLRHAMQVRDAAKLAPSEIASEVAAAEGGLAQVARRRSHITA